MRGAIEEARRRGLWPRRTRDRLSNDVSWGFMKVGGESGIRTHEPREGLPVFKTGVFNRSTISPSTVLWVLESGFNDFNKYRTASEQKTAYLRTV